MAPVPAHLRHLNHGRPSKTMSKTNTPTPKQPPNAQTFARLSHLYQASTALAMPSTSGETITDLSTANLSRFYLNHLRSVAKKSVLRIDPSIKRTICKRCDALLIPGVSCEHRIENKSKNGKKRWADVLIVECKACGTMKRFPVGMDGRKAEKGHALKLSSGDGDTSQRQEKSLGNKPDGKKRTNRDARIFRISETPVRNNPVSTAGVRDTDATMEESTEGHGVESLLSSIDAQMDDVPASNLA